MVREKGRRPARLCDRFKQAGVSASTGQFSALRRDAVRARGGRISERPVRVAERSASLSRVAAVCRRPIRIEGFLARGHREPTKSSCSIATSPRTSPIRPQSSTGANGPNLTETDPRNRIRRFSACRVPTSVLAARSPGRRGPGTDCAKTDPQLHQPQGRHPGSRRRVSRTGSRGVSRAGPIGSQLAHSSLL